MKAQPGSVSWGTLRTEDLIDSFIGALQDFGQDKTVESIRDEFGHTWDDDWCEENPDEASYMLEALMEELEKLAPSGYYFGAHEGDGADFGFWPDNDQG